MFFVSNLQSYSQAGRRGFESRLPLHLFNDLRTAVGFVLRLCSIHKQGNTNVLEKHGLFSYSSAPLEGCQ
jgi:hypothetical protein